jgi:hypothetical protein
MAEVMIQLKGQPWEPREPWEKTVDVSAGDAEKVAEWLKIVLPELIAHVRGGYYSKVDIGVKK